MVNRRGSKPDLNEASAEELVDVAGVKRETADTIVRLRREHGPVENVEQLKELAKFGKDELDKVNDSFNVVRNAAAATVKDAAEVGSESAQRVGEAVKETARKGTETAQQVAASAQGVAERGFDRMKELMDDQSGQLAPVARIGWLWLSFWPEQTAQGVATASRLLQCRSWPEAVKIQSEFALGSIDRLARRFSAAAELAANQTDRVRDETERHRRRAA